ncbi:MAG TPA: hypothetical protein VH643_04690 [Gemmataceae bacterium]|jgi:hypothetical protein
MRIDLSKLICLVALIVGAAPAASAAVNLQTETTAAIRENADGGSSSPTLFAVWSIGKWFSGSAGRARVVQLCVVTMCIALFIMMRKLN